MTQGNPLEPEKRVRSRSQESSPFDPLEAWPAMPRYLPEDDPDLQHPQTIAEVLEGNDSMRILRRIVDGDPLGIERIVHEELDHLAVMFEPGRLLAATQARCAWKGATDSPPTEASFLEWVAARMSEAMESLTQEDWSEERLRLPTDPMDERYLRSMGPFELPANQARRVALLFNQTAPRIRRPLYAVLIKHRPLAKVADAYGLGVEELQALTYDCLSAFRSTDARKPYDLDDITDWGSDS